MVKKNVNAISTEIMERTKSVFPRSSNNPLIFPSTKGSNIAPSKRYKKAIRIVCIVGIDTNINTDNITVLPVITEAVEEKFFIVLILSVSNEPTKGILFWISRFTVSLTVPLTDHVITPLTVMKILYKRSTIDVEPINVKRMSSDIFENEVGGCILLIKSNINAAIMAGIRTFPASTVVKEANSITAGFQAVIKKAPPEAAIPKVRIGYILRKRVTNSLVMD